VAFTRDGKTLVTNSQDGTLIFWDATTGAEVRRFPRGLPGAQALALSPDGKTLAGAGGHSIRLLDLATGKDRLPQAGLQYSVDATAISADGRTAVTACRNRIVLWDAATGKELGCPEGSPDLVEAIEIGADGRSLVALGCGNTQATWDVQTLQAWELPAGKEIRRVERKEEGASRLRLLALAPDGKTAAVQLMANKKRVCLFDLATGKIQRGFDLEGDTTQIYGAAFTPDGRTIIVWSSGDNMVRVWDVSTGRLLHHFVMTNKYGSADPDGNVYVAVISPDRWCILFGNQNFFILYDIATGRQLTRLDQPVDNPANGGLVAFSPDGRMFAWKGGRPRTIYLTETATLRERGQFTAPQGEVTTLTFAPDGRTLITGNSDTITLVWDLTGRLREKETWGKPLGVAELDACWSDLAGEDAGKAYRAVQKLAGSAKDAVAYLTPRLRPIPALDEKRVLRLIADLDSDDFVVREAATKELGKWEEAALSFYQKALENAPPLEARRRLEALIDEQARRRSHPSVQRLQILRALEVLERAGTPEARRVLETVAKGAPGASLTDEAKASLERSTKRAERDKHDPLP
jgi:WD40 repeat protein